jgi:hypothetical protein
MCMLKVIEAERCVDLEPLAFLRGDAHAKSNRSIKVRLSGAPSFC